MTLRVRYCLQLCVVADG